MIFAKNPNSVICLKIGGGFRSGPDDPGVIGPLEIIHLTQKWLLPTVNMQKKVVITSKLWEGICILQFMSVCLLTVFRQGRTLLDQGCPNFDENFFGASIHEKIEI